MQFFQIESYFSPYAFRIGIRLICKTWLPPGHCSDEHMLLTKDTWCTPENHCPQLSILSSLLFYHRHTEASQVSLWWLQWPQKLERYCPRPRPNWKTKMFQVISCLFCITAFSFFKTSSLHAALTVLNLATQYKLNLNLEITFLCLWRARTEDMCYHTWHPACITVVPLHQNLHILILSSLNIQ